jgi:DNA-binding beta-propeller fold protein YncE
MRIFRCVRALFALTLLLASSAGATQLFVTTPAGIRLFDPVTFADGGLFAAPPQGVSWLPISIALAPGGGELYVANDEGSTIERFDRETGAHLGTFATPNRPNEIEFGPNGDLYVLSLTGPFGPYEVRRYDGDTGAFLGTVVSTATGFGFGPDGYLYVARPVTSGGFIERYDPSSGALLGTVATAPTGAFQLTREIAFTPDGSSIIVQAIDLSILEPALVRFDLSTGQILEQALASYFFIGFDLAPSPDGSLYVPLDNTPGSFVHVDPWSLEPIGPLLGANPDFVAYAMVFVPEPDASLFLLVAMVSALRRRRSRYTPICRSMLAESK